MNLPCRSLAVLLACCIVSIATAAELQFQPVAPENFPPHDTAIPAPAFRHSGGPLTIGLEYAPALPHTWLLLDGNILRLRDAAGDEILVLDQVRRGRFRLKFRGETRISWPLLEEMDHIPLRIVITDTAVRLEAMECTWAELPGAELPPGEYRVTLAEPGNGIPGAFGTYRELTVSASSSPPLPPPDYPRRDAAFARIAAVDTLLFENPEFDLLPAAALQVFDRDSAGKAAVRIALDSLWKRLHLGRTDHFEAYLADLEAEAARWKGPASPAAPIRLAEEHGSGFLSADDPNYYFGFLGWEMGNYAPELALLGCNLVSDSVWPAQLIGHDGSFNTEHYRRRTLPSLKRLNQYGIGVDMLVAPFTPPFLLQQHPEWSGSYDEGRVAGHGFLSASIIHPDYREMCRIYLDHLIPRLDREPGVVSICLDNEPAYEDYSPEMQMRFRSFLRQRYTTIDALNLAWGTDYAGFDVISHERSATQGCYDWHLFCNEIGAAHLRWLHAGVKRHTQLPTHVKVLPWEFGLTWIPTESEERKESELADGIDRFAIARFTDIVGTDTYADRYSSEGEYCANTMYQSLYFDLISGYDRRKAVFDSEWHIAAIDARTPPDYIEMVMQQNVMHGLRAGTVWVMNPCVDACDIASDVPLMIRYAETAVKIRHMAGIYRALAERPRPIALLYSSKNRRLFDDAVIHPLQRLHEASLFTGLGIRVIDERQLLEGNLEGVRAIVSAGVPVPEEGTAEALAQFCCSGGVFVRIGEFGDSVPGEIRYEETNDKKELQQILFETAARARILPTVRVGDAAGAPIAGVEFHTVQDEIYGHLLYVVNYSGASQDLVIHGVRTIHDLHSGKRSGNRLRLPVCGTLLAVMDPEESD